MLLPVAAATLNYLPSDFLFGFASSATQVEGFVDFEAKSLSQWDTFAKIQGKIVDNTTPNMTIGEYSHMDQTIAILKEAGAKAYRLSISWTRLVPNGFADSQINHLAVAHYRSYLEKLKSNGIVPLVTIYHWDIPDALNKQYGGILNTELFTRDFLYFANATFASFGDLVDNWVTFNEPNSICLAGYGVGIHAPGVNEGVSLEGYKKVLRCGHSILLAHGKTVDLFRKSYKGRISLVNNIRMFRPLDKSNLIFKGIADLLIDLCYTWFVDPIYFGDYPTSMKRIFEPLGILPKFSDQEKQLLRNSSDYLAFNMYLGSYIGIPGDFANDLIDAVKNTNVKEIISTVLNLVAEKVGITSNYNSDLFLESMLFLQERYNNPEMWIMENGFKIEASDTTLASDLENDDFRVQWFSAYLEKLESAVNQHKINLKSYIVWCLIDNWEWNYGKTQQYGVYGMFNGTIIGKKSSRFLRDYFSKAISSKNK